MSTTFAQDLIASLTEAVDHAKGNKTGAREHLLEIPDVRSLREQLAMSQQAFSSAYRIPLATLKAGSRAAASRMRPPPPFST